MSSLKKEIELPHCVSTSVANHIIDPLGKANTDDFVKTSKNKRAEKRLMRTKPVTQTANKDGNPVPEIFNNIAA